MSLWQKIQGREIREWLTDQTETGASSPACGTSQGPRLELLGTPKWERSWLLIKVKNIYHKVSNKCRETHTSAIDSYSCCPIATAIILNSYFLCVLCSKTEFMPGRGCCIVSARHHSSKTQRHNLRCLIEVYATEQYLFILGGYTFLPKIHR